MRPLRSIISALTLVAGLLAVGSTLVARTDPSPSMKPAEYMIYQYPRVSLVVVIDARETEFEARITGPEGAPVSETGIAARRIGPVYQFVDAVDTPRQLMIQVNPARRVDRSRISMELLQIPESDRNAQALAQAYRFLAHGMRRVYTDSTTTWAERSYSLRNAARAFSFLGMEEMSLWSEYYATHLVLHQIGDVLLALERGQAVQAAAERAGFETIELAAATLEADALMVAGEKSRGDQAVARYESAHDSWQRVIRMAGELGFEAERGRALYRDGIAYERQGRLDRAIERYEQALEVTGAAGDPDLLNEVRATAAAAYENRGSTSGAISLLDDIAGDLSDQEESAQQELARNLYEKGRLLNRTFRYREAAQELARSLDLQRNDPSIDHRGLAGLEMGQALYALGYLEQAESEILESLPRTSLTEKRAQDRAWGTLAAIAREQGRFGPMADYRVKQGRLRESAIDRAAFLFESALDALEQDRPGSANAGRLFREAREAAIGSDLLTGARASLYLCRAELHARGAGACDPGRVRAGYELLRHSGIPTVEVDTELAWAGVLSLAGKHDEARIVATGLVDSVQFYRERLPGAIAPWYSAHREALFRLYLELARRSSAEDLLLALERLRRLERVTADAAAIEDTVRGQIARVAAAQPAPGDELSRRVHARLESFREQSGWSGGALSRDGLRRNVQSLGRNESILTYLFSGPDVYAVSANRKGIDMQRLAGAGRAREPIEAVRTVLRDAAAGTPDEDLEKLGRWLLKPVAGRLEQTVYFLPSGPLNGFPLDALRLDGRYLAQRHRVVNLGSLTSLETPVQALGTGFGRQVFLAGNPRAGRDLFSYGVTTSGEIDAVRDRFVGDGLHIVQGVALQSDEFEDDRYGTASLVHLAMPGRVDLAYPDRSRLLLSGERESPAAEFMTPEQVRAITVQARLAVLSGTSFTARARTDYDSRVGLVDDLQAAGAPQVLAALWPAGDTETAAFMGDFYRALETENDVAGALYETRKSRIASKSDTNIRSWAGFQLFIR